MCKFATGGKILNYNNLYDGDMVNNIKLSMHRHTRTHTLCNMYVCMSILSIDHLLFYIYSVNTHLNIHYILYIYLILLSILLSLFCVLLLTEQLYFLLPWNFLVKVFSHSYICVTLNSFKMLRPLVVIIQKQLHFSTGPCALN